MRLLEMRDFASYEGKSFAVEFLLAPMEGIGRKMKDHSVLDEVVSKLVQSQETLPSNVMRRNGPFIVLNEQGAATPLVWCFNNWIEPLSLAHRLGANQPILATRSFYGLLSGKAAKKSNLGTLAEAYVNDLLALHPDGPKVLGGNCQSAPIAEAMAHALISKGYKAPTLIVLDHSLQYCYPGRVVFLFGANSVEYNPFLQGKDPTERWQQQFASVDWAELPAQHGGYFRDPCIAELSARLRHQLDLTNAVSPTAVERGFSQLKRVLRGGR